MAEVIIILFAGLLLLAALVRVVHLRVAASESSRCPDRDRLMGELVNLALRVPTDLVSQWRSSSPLSPDALETLICPISDTSASPEDLRTTARALVISLRGNSTFHAIESLELFLCFCRKHERDPRKELLDIIKFAKSD